MEESTLQELNQLMARDETGMNVVLIDVAGNLARIHKVYPGLAKRFEYVGKMGPEEVAYVAPEGDDRPVRPVQLRKTEEAAAPRTALRRTEEPAAGKVQPVAEPAAIRSLPKPETEQKPAAERKAGTEQKPKPERRKMEESRPEPAAPREDIKKSPLRRRKTLRSCLSRKNRIMMTSRRWILMNLPSMHANMPAILTAAYQERACWPSMSALKLWRKTAYPLQR